MTGEEIKFICMLLKRKKEYLKTKIELSKKLNPNANINSISITVSSKQFNSIVEYISYMENLLKRNNISRDSEKNNSLLWSSYEKA